MLAVLAITTVFALPALAADTTAEAISAFRKMKTVGDLSLKVTSTIEVPLSSGEFEWRNFAVLEVESGQFQPSYYYRNIVEDKTGLAIEAGGRDLTAKLTDGRPETYADFAVPADRTGLAVFKIKTDRPISSESLYFRLARYVALPNTIEIRISSEGSEKIVLARAKAHSRLARFPEFTSDKWIIEFTYSQPLRITELDLRENDARRAGREGLRFLARSDMTYELYFDSDRNPDIEAGEAPNLRDNEGVIITDAYPTVDNPAYTKADTDSDGVPDEADNCVRHENPDQADLDGNLRGDVCDDFDRDGIVNSRDNCPDHPNRHQRDEDGDGVGDECDSEESRLTEKYRWLPWTGMGLVLAAIYVMFTNTMKKK